MREQENIERDYNQKQPMSGTDRSIQEMTEEIAMLEETISALIQKLEPVIIEEEVATADGSSESRSPIPNTQLGRRIAERTERLRQIRQRTSIVMRVIDL